MKILRNNHKKVKDLLQNLENKIASVEDQLSNTLNDRRTSIGPILGTDGDSTYSTNPQSTRQYECDGSVNGIYDEAVSALTELNYSYEEKTTKTDGIKRPNNIPNEPNNLPQASSSGFHEEILDYFESESEEEDNSKYFYKVDKKNYNIQPEPSGKLTQNMKYLNLNK